MFQINLKAPATLLAQKSILLWIVVGAGAVTLAVFLVWLYYLNSDTPPAPITPNYIPDSHAKGEEGLNPVASETNLGVAFEEYTKEVQDITSDYLTIKQDGSASEINILAIENVRDGFNNYHSPKTVDIVDNMNLDSQVYQQHLLALNTPLPPSPISMDSDVPMIVVNNVNAEITATVAEPSCESFRR